MTKAVLAALQSPHQPDQEIVDNLVELAQLAEDAGLTVVGQVIQKRPAPVPATYIGLGKIEDIKVLLSDADHIVIFDDELTPAQQGNLSELLDAPVLDRTQLILDIFARRARTKEGKIQVELAQLKYLLPRLTGHGTALSRLGGGIGTRGPGETKLETDRRRIRKRIADLEDELDFVRKVRQLHMARRKRNQVPLVTLVGYTNAGKSSLFSALTAEPAFAADQLFATLDPLIRKWQTAEGEWVYLSDTVGFIRKLPTTLIAAFRATLEEVLAADLLLHVLDASHPLVEQQKAAVEGVLNEIGCDTPIINVYNKIDRIEGPLITEPEDLQVSALTKANLESVGAAVSRFFAAQFVIKRYLLPFDQLALLSVIHEQGEVIDEEYQADGVLVRAKVKKALAKRLQKYEIMEM
ncbi:MAG: GTPase HflX [Limnochordia bacterium]|nr:GTPase HflX [Limnochordia bacterium]